MKNKTIKIIALFALLILTACNNAPKKVGQEAEDKSKLRAILTPDDAKINSWEFTRVGEVGMVWNHRVDFDQPIFNDTDFIDTNVIMLNNGTGNPPISKVLSFQVNYANSILYHYKPCGQEKKEGHTNLYFNNQSLTYNSVVKPTKTPPPSGKIDFDKNKTLADSNSDTTIDKNIKTIKNKKTKLKEVPFPPQEEANLKFYKNLRNVKFTKDVNNILFHFQIKGMYSYKYVYTQFSIKDSVNYIYVYCKEIPQSTTLYSYNFVLQDFGGEEHLKYPYVIVPLPWDDSGNDVENYCVQKSLTAKLGK